jgi:hypothetical protein
MAGAERPLESRADSRFPRRPTTLPAYELGFVNAPHYDLVRHLSMNALSWNLSATSAQVGCHVTRTS